jgi:hypothetical protein
MSFILGAIHPDLFIVSYESTAGSQTLRGTESVIVCSGASVATKRKRRIGLRRLQSEDQAIAVGLHA